MILVISHIADDAAQTLVDEFPPGAAALITASNFYQSFKCGINVQSFASSPIIINGKALPAGDISGVITTIPHFIPQEFFYINPGDREYVCSEMNAFFTWFLSELECKKLNPPTVRCLTGLNLFKTAWINTARAQQIPVWPVQLVNGAHAACNTGGVRGFYCYTIIDGVIPGTIPPPPVVSYMHALQKAFDMPYMRCYFIEDANHQFFLSDIVFVPDVSDPLIREAITGYFNQNSLYDITMGPDGRYAHEYGACGT